MSEKKILIIEDLADMQALFKAEMGLQFHILSAVTLEEAEELFKNHAHELSAIAVDACVPGTTPTTLPLVKQIRGTFQGPLIAISNSGEYRKLLRQSGCDYDCEKEELPRLLREIIN